MTLPIRRLTTRLARAALTTLTALGAPALTGGAALAQVTPEPDGQWQHLLTAGLNLNSGNTRTRALNLNVELDSGRVSVSTQSSGDLEPWRSTDSGRVPAEESSLHLRHTTRPPLGLRRMDPALVTGLSVRFG